MGEQEVVVIFATKSPVRVYSCKQYFLAKIRTE